MTDHDWQTSNDPERMLQSLRGKGRLTPRKTRLFMCACCRRNWHLLSHWASQKAVEASEQFAEGQLTAEALRSAAAAAELYPEPFPIDWNGVVSLDFSVRDWRRYANALLLGGDWQGIAAALAVGAAGRIRGEEIVVPFLAVLTHAVELYPNSWDAWFWWRIGRAHAEILRHVLGPLAVPQKPAYGWSGQISELAAAVERGEPYLFALHDALHDAGHPDIADHFRDPDERHPKGCWAIDLLLGKD